MIRDSHAQHSTGYGQGFKDCRLDAIPRQMIGCRESGWTGACDCNLFMSLIKALYINFSGIKLISRQPLEIADGYRLIDFTSPAGVFTAMRADSPQHTRKGQVFHDDVEGFFVFSLFYHLHITLDIDAGRAGQATGGLAFFLYSKGTGDGLCVFFIGSLSIAHALIIFIG